MSEPQKVTKQLTPFEQLSLARDIIRNEAESLTSLADRLPTDFSESVNKIVACKGSVLVAGVGKAGWIGQKLSASFASTGTRSHFLHPGEAMHGDLGRVGPNDVVLVLSNSGETEEIVRLLPTLAKMDVSVIAMTANGKSTLGRGASLVLDYGSITEACPMGLAPSTSTTVMLALGDALALVASQVRQFTHLDFAKYHPGGSLGRKLATVDEIMRSLDQCRIAHQTETIREILVSKHHEGRRSGAIMLVDDENHLVGIFTDSDLAKLLEHQRDAAIDLPISEVMTQSPVTVLSGERIQQAVDILSARSISELPVVNEKNELLGMIDITDVVGVLPSNNK